MNKKMNNITNKDGSVVDVDFVASIPGISNVAVDVASVVGSYSIFSQQNKKYAEIGEDLIFYQNYALLKSMLIDVSRKIMSRYHSGFSRKKQSKLKQHVAICRYLGLLPYLK